MAIQPNALNVYASYNNIFTFSCLTKDEVNSPGSYRSGGPSKVILKSGGTGGENKVTTAAEDAMGIRAEYFIDDVTIDSIITPTQGTRTTNATRIQFKVIEPYSMGLFLQACKVAAIENGYSNYMQSSFLLMIDFVGWGDDGNFISSGNNTRYYPLKLTNVTFVVTANGTEYDVEAIPWNEQAFVDQIENTKSDIALQGKTVEELLQTGEKSLTTILNGRFNELKAEDKLKEADEIEIQFPSDFAPNDIGPSGIIDSHNDPGQVPMGESIDQWDPSNKVFKRSMNTVSEDQRTFSFSAGTKISRIIEEVVITSDYGKELIDRAVDGNGMVDWFKVESQVYFKPNPEQENLDGSDAKRYVYRVMPFKIHHTMLVKPTDAGKSYQQLRNNAVKEYNYIYSGENLDILDFNIEVNAGFFTLTQADYGQNNKERQTGYAVGRTVEQDERVLTITDPVSNSSPTGNVLQENVLSLSTLGAGGAGIDTDKVRTARQFHESVLQGGVDLINLELTIHGDPYFIADSGMGNYSAGSAGLNITSDGTVNYQASEVDIIVNFRTPVDYSEGTSVMQLVDQYSGLYRVVKVENNWNSNKFSQTLKLLRRRMQEDLENVSGGEENKNTDATTPERSNTPRDPGTSPCGGPGGGGAGTPFSISFNETPTSATTPTGGSSSLAPTTSPRPQARPVAAPQRSFGTFNADGTVQGPGQAARPGPRPAPTVRASNASVNSGGPGFRPGQ